MRTTRRGSWLLAAMLTLCSGCTEHRSPGDMIVVAMANAATNLDPRVGSDEASQKAHQLLYSTLVRIDEKLRVVSDLAELEQPDPVTYVARLRHGVLFHNGRELTSEDVVYTFRSFLDPDVSRSLRRVPAARVGKCHRSIHGVVHAEGAVRLVSGEPGDGDRPGGFRSRECATADWHGPVPACGVRSGRSDRPQALPFVLWRRACQLRRHSEGRAGRHNARPRASQGHGRPRRQRSGAGRHPAAARRGPAAGDVSGRHRLRLHRSEPARSGAAQSGCPQGDRLCDRPRGHRQVPSTRVRDSRGRDRPTDVLGIRAQRVRLSPRSGGGAAAARCRGFSRS